ncbi:MAG: hypothetical protein ACREU8_01450 [Gammaproteobacteria bacterium]
MRSVIERVSFDPNTDASVRGSKFIFDPYYFYGPQVFSHLRRVIEPEIKLILLKRHYLDTWLSWKARGVYHDIDYSVVASGPRLNAMLDAMRNMPKPTLQTLVLHHGPGAMSEHDGIAYPLVTAIDDLLQAYANDVQMLALVEERGGMVVDYADISRQLPGIARFIGSCSTDEEIEAVIRKPQTRKLASLEGHLHPIEPLRTISGALDRSFAMAAEGHAALALAWTWGADKDAAIGAPLVVEAIKAFGFPVSGAALRWTVQKPVVN